MVNRITKRYGLLSALLVIALLALAAPVAAGTVTINPGNDIGAAIMSAGSSGTVILNPGVYYQSGITVGNAITIRAADGHGPWDTRIDGSRSGNSIFTVSGDYALAIDNLTFQNGVNSSSSGGYGGAINAGSGSVTVISSIFTGCSASSGTGGSGGFGGAINTGSGSVTVISSTFTGCSASSSSGGYGRGGAIYTSGGSVTVTSGTFTWCSAGSSGGSSSGGAIYTENGSVTVTSSTFTGCSASSSGSSSSGGAIYAGSGSVTITSGTFTGCLAGNSGVIVAGSVNITSSTFTGCSVGNSGQIIQVFHGGTIRFCRIYNPGPTEILSRYDYLDASDNWWGTNSDPSAYLSGSIYPYSPWLVLGISASPSTITTGGTSTISANLTYGSDKHPTSGGTVANDIPVVFTVTGGTLSASTVYTDSGIASTTFTPSSTGTAYITATVDGQSVTVPVTVVAGGPATSIVIDPATPSNIYAGISGVGVYTSANGGSTWNPMGRIPRTDIRALAISPASDHAVYAGTYGGGVFRSTTGTTTWNSCTALSNQNVRALVTNSTGAVFAGTDVGIFVSTDECAHWTTMNMGLSA
ncbi:Ig-like domain-containing protein [Methanoregula sp. UBA64]|uniref:Ig-like domain-containing protein n=1 Tax=Methanoregula sp. UBA64 TaxID=1915554 RepID=UPI0025EACA84|nr:Ig-like domain-containing protein [Methanoregula sp. UBA64]